ncbi:dienelactone hydrolase family protein [Sphingomonas sp. KC8]|uniref:dienelactone hydrolase family protein n=1 Tax=Sphingomonas sp. KC8 TaxID=1030157 RepID=UPI000248B8A7|nr:dienelactone hydrolase family protein [Sphingomonas sp. KC8]ARS28462.1 dienelactone hydrolase [Sphingomonas sp. KC8]
MAIRTRTVEYQGPGGPFEGVFVWDDALSGPRPGVIVFHNVMGLKAFDVDKATELAGLGYVAFAADMYGKGKRPIDRDAAFMLGNDARSDRRVLQERLLATLATIRAQPETDAAHIAAIGFCFGGTCVLDLARAGADVDGVVSFHGVYDRPPFANADPIRAKVLVLHGWDDPFCPPAATVDLAAELTESKADWQIHAYGHTGHAFTSPTASGPGLAYQPDADRRSWLAMRNFLDELWG